MLKLFSYSIIALLFTSLQLISCKSNSGVENSGSQTSGLPSYDSLKAKQIEATVNEINVGVSIQGPPKRIPFPIYNAEDTLDYWVVNNEPARISVNLIYSDKVIWPTFFVKNNELILVRYRIWVQVYPSFARERMIYLDHGKIVYCKERSMDLAPGDIPAYLRDKPFSICSNAEKDIKQDYEDYWMKVQEFLADKIDK